MNKLNNIKLFKYLCSKTTGLTSTEKLVAIILMSHRNNVSMMCCPGLTLLEQETGLNRRTIQRAIQSLVIKKELIRLRIKKAKKFFKNQYYFFFDISVALSIYKNKESAFNIYHAAEIENFEHWLYGQE